MSENANLEKRALEALLRYREALARVEALEKEEAKAHQALVEWRGRVEKSTSDLATSIARSNLVEAGQDVISRLHNIRFAMSEATAGLKSAFTTLVAFDDALGYLPIPEATDSNVKDAGDRPEE
jgi:DNA repair ATPase RecN